MNTEIEEVWDGTFWLTNDRWVCQLEDEKDIHLGLLVEIEDITEWDADFEDLEYCLTLNPCVFVVPEEMHPDFKKRCDNNDGEYPFTIMDARFYSGGVYALDFLDGITSNAKTTADFQMREWPNGHAGRFFKTFIDAEQYIRDIYASHAEALFGFVGFFLDRRVNMVGHTGWDEIALQARNKEKRDW